MRISSTADPSCSARLPRGTIVHFVQLLLTNQKAVVDVSPFDRSINHMLYCRSHVDVRREHVHLVVRRNALLKRADWPPTSEWSAEFYAALKRAARDYSRTERVVGRLLGWRTWRPLNDREFKLLKL